MTKIFALFMCFTAQATPYPHCSRFAHAPIYYNLADCEHLRKSISTDPGSSIQYRCLSLAVPVWQ
jgi:hypothetical protein